MSLLSLFGISTAYAATASGSAAAPHHGGLLGMLPMLIIFIVVFYFLLIRPQSKRAKQQKQMLADIGVGDEIVTAGGFVGKIINIEEQYIDFVNPHNVKMRVQKSSISSILPKGSMKTSKSDQKEQDDKKEDA